MGAARVCPRCGKQSGHTFVICALPLSVEDIVVPAASKVTYVVIAPLLTVFGHSFQPQANIVYMGSDGAFPTDSIGNGT